jgi:hypothetical protein
MMMKTAKTKGEQATVYYWKMPTGVWVVGCYAENDGLMAHPMATATGGRSAGAAKAVADKMADDARKAGYVVTVEKC